MQNAESGPQSRPRHHMRINLRRRHVRVPEQILQRADIHARLQQVGRERMSQHMRRDALVQFRRPRRLSNRVLESRIQHMVPPAQAGVRIAHHLAGREHVPAISRAVPGRASNNCPHSCRVSTAGSRRPRRDSS